MKAIRSFVIFLCLLLPTGGGFAQYLLVTDSLQISTTSTFDSVRVTSSGALIADDSIAVLGNMIIDSSGVVTHSLRLLSGLRLKVLGTLEVKSGGAIDVSGKGLLGGQPTIGGSPGEAYNPSGDSIIAGATGSPETGGGGSYGGRGGSGAKGGVSNEPYGLIEDVRHVGAGGGGINSAWGGHGGGLIVINATSCIVNGTIRANGGEGFAGFDNSGAGSGGGIRINVGSLSGAGIIEALGGVAYWWDVGGCGGGGRIAIFYDSLNIPTENILIHSGIPETFSNENKGSAGTIYLKDNAQPLGIIIIGNNNINSPFFTPWRTAFPTVQKLTLRNLAQMRTTESDNTTFGEVSLESNSIFILDTNTTVKTPVVNIASGTLTAMVDRSFPVGTDLQISDGGTFNVQNNRTLSLGVFDTTNIHSGTVNMTDGTQLNITANTATISQDVTLVKDGTFGTSDSINTLTINSGGIITHSLRLLAGLQLNVLGTLEVHSGGAIDVSGKGLLGGPPSYPPTTGGSPGEAYNPSGDSIVAGATGSDETGGGGSYGGRGGSGGKGGVSNEPYGLIEDVRYVGAGGGGNNNTWGGHGGGLIVINATTCIVDGTIRANGGEGSGGFDNSGAGSGGGIRINVGSLSGAGIIEALGGVAYWWDVGGCGGGGRIAIFYDSLNIPTENILIHSGIPETFSNENKGSAGTIYLKDNAQPLGIIIIGNNNINSPFFTPWRTAFPTVQKLTLRNLAQMRTTESDNTTFGEISVESNSIFILDTNTVVQTPVVHIAGGTLNTLVDRSFPVGTDLQLSGGGTINVQNNRTLSVGVFDTTNIHSGTVNMTDGTQLNITANTATISQGVTLVKDGTFGASDSINTLTINSGGIVTHSLRLLSGLRLKVLGTLEVKSGGAIDVSGKGLLGGQPTIGGAPGEAYNPSGDSIVAGATGSPETGGGGSYGGRGGSGGKGGVSNEPYGLIEDVQYVGAGGGGNNHTWGGHGGGLIVINATSCIVNGTIRANGGEGSGGFDNSGAGSGGGIRMDVGSFSGAGIIEALGGVAYNWDFGGCGGGGRIAILYDSLSIPTGNILVHTGTTGAAGSAGTIYLKDNAQNLGSVIVDNANFACDLYTPWLSGLSSLQNLRVIRAGKLEVITEVNIEGPILISGGGTIGRP